MNLRSLKYFVATVEAGSISAASTRCHVAQPSITLAIAKLEDELGCKLFDRHRKGSSATEDGLRMYKMATELLSHAESIKHQFTSVKSQEKITLAVDKSIRVSVLEQFLNDANTAFGVVQFELLSVVDAVNVDKADIHLSTKGQLEKSSIFIPLSIESYSLLIPKANLLAYQQELKPVDLNQQSIISRIYCENQALFDQVVDNLGLDLNIVAQVESEEWAHALVAAGLGMTMAPVPASFEDPRFITRSLEECFGMALPKREVGLLIKSDKIERVKRLLPGLIS